MNEKHSQSTRRNQYLAYVGILLLVGVGSSWAYHDFRGAYVALRQAEKRFAQMDFAGSIPLYRRALQEGAIRDQAVRHLVEAYRRIGNAESAASFLATLGRQNGEPSIVFALAGLYESEGRWDEIISLLLPLVPKWPASSTVTRRLADAYRNTNRPEEAILWYRRAMAIRPESFYIRFRLAELLAWNRQYEEAIRLFHSLLKEDPEYRPTRLYLARVLAWSGREEEAIRQYRILLGDKT